MYKCKYSLILRFTLLISVFSIIPFSCSHYEDVPQEKIKERFKMVTGLDLPGKAENMRAIYPLMNYSQIFVKFETDPEGITKVL